MKPASGETFLEGGGELGKLIRAKDWTKTPLGDPANWPQSLKTAVRIVLTSSQPMFVWWGPELINIYNDAYVSIVGGKHPESLGQPAIQVWAEIWEAVEPRVKACMEENRGTYDEALLLLMERNGYTEETYYTFSYSPIPGDDGTTQGILCANTDDTGRIIGERQMRTLRELARNLLDVKSNTEIYQKSMAALEGNPQDFPFAVLYEVSDDGKHLKLVGKTPENLSEELSGPSIDLVTEIGKFPEVENTIFNGKITGVGNIVNRFGSFETSYWKKSPDRALLIPIAQANHEFPFAMLGVGLNPYRLLDEDYRDFFNLAADQIATALTNSYALKRERKRAQALAEIDQAKTVFFSNISHEFRTPLTLMLGPVEDMLNGDRDHLTEEDLSNLEITHRNAIRLLRLVNSLLDFSRMEAGRTQARFRGICLGAFTTDLAASFRSLFEKAGLGFEVSADVQSGAYVDTDMWEKIMLNLLSNAYKYTLSGKVTVSVTEDSQHIVVKVSDTGTGIPEAEMPRLFERFHRVKNASGRSFEGTGIGLSLVKELVALNHGEISAESKEGVGTTFTIKMPIGKAHLSPDEIDESTPYNEIVPNTYDNSVIQSETRQTVLPKTDTAGKPHLLIVDDNPDMRDYLGKLLGRDYRLSFAGNGKEGLERVALSHPDLIVSDIMMPEMDGIEMMQQLKSSSVTRKIPLLLLSARAGEEARLEGYGLGADDYLVKPFSAKELQARIQSQLRISRTRSHIDQQLRNMIMQSPVAIGLLRGPDFVVEIANERMLALWGRSAMEIIGRPVFEGLPGVAEQGFGVLLESVFASGKTFTTDEMPIDLKRNGATERLYIKFVYEPYFEEDGSVSGIMVVADDISDSVEHRMRIEASETRHKLAIEAARMGSFEWNIAQKHFIYSPRLAEIFGFEDNGTFQHQDFIDRIHPEDVGIRNAAVDRALTDGTLFYEARIIHLDGSTRWIRLNGKIESTSGGQAEKMFGTILDITDEKQQSSRLEEMVAHRTRSLEQKNRELVESEERYQRMTEEVEDYAILLLDTKGTILNWNKGAEKIKGYLESEIIGRNIDVFYLPEDQKIRLSQK